MSLSVRVYNGSESIFRKIGIDTIDRVPFQVRDALDVGDGGVQSDWYACVRPHVQHGLKTSRHIDRFEGSPYSILNFIERKPLSYE